jgi:hypothetical protein
MDDGQPFSQIRDLKDIVTTGSLCRMTLTPQMIFQKRRVLITLEGIDRIKMVKELSDGELEGFFERAKDEKVKELGEKLENALKLKQNNQIITSSTDQIKE